MKVRMVSAALATLPMAGGGCLGGLEVFTTTSGTSAAGDDSGSDDSSNSLLLTGAVLLGLSVVGTVVAFTAEDDGAFSYLQEHQQEVRVALARGEGPFVTDMGQRLGLPAPLVPHLGATLRAARPTLEPPLTAGAIDRDGAREFSRELVRALAEDPVLAPWLDDALTVATSN